MNGYYKDIKYVAITALFSISFALAALIFCEGLLLRRDVLAEKSICMDDHDVVDCYNLTPDRKQCCKDHNERYKVVLIIVDALRYDFTVYNDSLPFAHYRNKLTAIKNALKEKPKFSRLFKFVADPPTTTTQRIVGLTTGSLPTFVDIGANFASSESKEDNLLDAIMGRRKKTVFMGDDTWLKLYPGRFERSYPYYSFNNWDLDTCDKGVAENLKQELEKEDWNLLVAHFLGVDHCGHMYGANHTEMGRKLDEINQVIQFVMQEIEKDKNTILFVIGDHGMTSTGDHGGESENELTSAMFVYSPSVELHPSDRSSDSNRQVDLVPTLSSILAIPIPFSNVGFLITEALPMAVDVAKSAYKNARQIAAYISAYAEKNPQFSGEIGKITERYEEMARNWVDQDVGKSRSFAEDVARMCREVWVKFDYGLAWLGICLLALLAVSMLRCCYVTSEDIFEICTGKRLWYLAGALISWALTSALLHAAERVRRLDLTIYFGCIVIFLASNTFLWMESIKLAEKTDKSTMKKVVNVKDGGGLADGKFPRLKELIKKFVRSVQEGGDVASLAAISLTNLAMFSNSFIVEEASVVGYLYASLMLCCIFSPPPALPFPKKNRPKRVEFQAKFAFAGVCCILARFLASAFTRCREEQTWCLTKDTEEKFNGCGALACLIFVAFWQFLSKLTDNLSYESVPQMCRVYCPQVSLLLLLAYWLCEGTLRKGVVDDLEPLCYAPAIVICGQLAMQSYSYWDSLSVTMERTPFRRGYNTRLKGLLTVYGAYYGNASVTLCLLGCALVGQAYAVAIVAVCCSIWSIAFAVATTLQKPSQFTLESTRWRYVALWGMSAVFWFYGTGHNATFPGIPWKAAFIFNKNIDDKFAIPAMLVVGNTFISYIIHAMLLPLLVMAPFILSYWRPSLITNGGEIGATNELTMLRHRADFEHSLFVAMSKYLLFFIFRILSAMLTAVIHSRHLMMWQIFAPKFVFECLAFAVTAPCTILSFVAVCRINRQINGLFEMYEIVASNH